MNEDAAEELAELHEKQRQRSEEKKITQSEPCKATAQKPAPLAPETMSYLSVPPLANHASDAKG